MSLTTSIADRIVEVTLGGRSQIMTCAAYGISCEGWLKVELVRGFSQPHKLGDGIEILPERQNTDLVIRSPSEEVLLEIKTFPTNYGRWGGKPITNSINGVVEDLCKLSRKRGSRIGLSAWMAYVIPDPIPTSWPRHLANVEAAAATTLRAERLPLWDNAFANLYIMACR